MWKFNEIDEKTTTNHVSESTKLSRIFLELVSGNLRQVAVFQITKGSRELKHIFFHVSFLALNPRRGRRTCPNLKTKIARGTCARVS
jgi:hypothetical protein